MDPLSVGTLLAGLASSVAGGSMNRRAQMRDYTNQLDVEAQESAQRVDEARARNAVLEAYRNRNDGYVASNQGDFSQALSPFAAGAQETRRSGEEARRIGDINATVDAGNYGRPQLGVFDSPTVTAAYDAAIENAVAKARDNGVRSARVSSYGDTWGRNDEDIGTARRGIATTNAIARSDNSTLPAAQDLAGFKTERIINKPAPTDRSVGNLLTSLGGFAGSVAGSGRLGGPTWDSLFNKKPVNVGSATSAFFP